jgi:lactoylglutathione lyase
LSRLKPAIQTSTNSVGRVLHAALGDGYGHFAVVVDDLDGEDARMEAAQLKPGPLHELKHGGARIARFFFIKDPDGYSTEVIERGGRFR